MRLLEGWISRIRFGAAILASRPAAWPVDIRTPAGGKVFSALPLFYIHLILREGATGWLAGWLDLRRAL